MFIFRRAVEMKRADVLVLGKKGHSTFSGTFKRFINRETITGALLKDCPCKVTVVPLEVRERIWNLFVKENKDYGTAMEDVSPSKGKQNFPALTVDELEEDSEDSEEDEDD